MSADKITVSDVKGRHLPALDILSMVVKHVLGIVTGKAGFEKTDFEAFVLVVPQTWSRNATECLKNATVTVNKRKKYLLENLRVKSIQFRRYTGRACIFWLQLQTPPSETIFCS